MDTPATDAGGEMACVLLVIAVVILSYHDTRIVFGIFLAKSLKGFHLVVPLVEMFTSSELSVLIRGDSDILHGVLLSY
jgi:hypothetical protein